MSGGAGSMLAMIKTLKANRNARRSKKDTGNKDAHLNSSGFRKLEYKKVSEAELAQIKSDIQHKKRKEKLKNLTVLSILSSGVLIFMIWFFLKN